MKWLLIGGERRWESMYLLNGGGGFLLVFLHVIVWMEEISWSFTHCRKERNGGNPEKKKNTLGLVIIRRVASENYSHNGLNVCKTQSTSASHHSKTGSAKRL